MSGRITWECLQIRWKPTEFTYVSVCVTEQERWWNGRGAVKLTPPLLLLWVRSLGSSNSAHSLLSWTVGSSFPTHRQDVASLCSGSLCVCVWMRAVWVSSRRSPGCFWACLVPFLTLHLWVSLHNQQLQIPPLPDFLWSILTSPALRHECYLCLITVK